MTTSEGCFRRPGTSEAGVAFFFFLVETAIVHHGSVHTIFNSLLVESTGAWGKDDAKQHFSKASTSHADASEILQICRCVRGCVRGCVGAWVRGCVRACVLD